MADRLQIKFASTLLEQIFQTLAKQVHDHNVEHAAIFELFITYKVEEGHKGLASHLVNQFGLPEQHNMALTFDCFFHFGCKVFARLLLLDFEDLAKSINSLPWVILLFAVIKLHCDSPVPLTLDNKSDLSLLAFLIFTPIV